MKQAKTEGNLFAYGTLMCPEIMLEVCGTVLASRRALLRGFSRYRIRDEFYPGILPDPGGFVGGVVYFGVSDELWQGLDRFEGDMYERVPVTPVLMTGEKIEAFAYVVKPAFYSMLTGEEWDFHEFLTKFKDAFRSSYRGFE
ncbi:gamma-glutamylcyclotransferase family protein [Thermodesulforhabdus norvegica]|uniref:Putative gamma-glutamylcyclotransferase n=1 Tax=Thermodesulforhabdus norvegica TaxID=39841 RepID=A0A1I4R890_9BACT|nr:gamma-glutamylcyclotransferase family protein [Thermodesulforhabdus norvegica]SFM48395.1 Gamma-glutamyl cyclotransferase, AIG2-like [Thermodesulforhabdus norvegica]